jgi:hypothetical protein
MASIPVAASDLLAFGLFSQALFFLLVVRALWRSFWWRRERQLAHKILLLSVALSIRRCWTSNHHILNARLGSVCQDA